MHINTISPYSPNFQARIKIDKSRAMELATNSSMGTTGTASLAAQTDYDLACANASIATVRPDSNTYEGIILPIYVESNKNGADLSALSANLATIPLGLQLCSIKGFNLLDKATDKKLTETYNNIDKEAKEVLALSDTAVGAIAISTLDGFDINDENSALLGTTVVPLVSTNITAIADAYKKTNSNNKKIPS